MADPSTMEVPPVVQSDRVRTHKGVGVAFLALSLLAYVLCIFLPRLGGLDSQGIFLLCAIGLGVAGLGMFSRCQGRSALWGGLGFIPVFGPLLFFVAVAVDSLLSKRAVRTSVRQQVFVAIALGGCIFVLYLAIAIPNFMEYGARARQAEATTKLGDLFNSAMAVKAKHGTFAISDIAQLKYQPAGSHRYSLWYAVKGVPTMLPLSPGTQYVAGPCDVTTPPATVPVGASATGFTAAAKGNMDQDAVCDEWSINEKGELLNTLNDAAH